MGDGTTWYRKYQRDGWENVTNMVETYSTGYGATPLTRTRQYVYNNSADLVQVIGPRGETLAGYYYDAKHHVLRATNAVGEVTAFTYDGAGRLTSIKTAAGLTTTNIYFSTGEYTNFVQTRIDIEISRTNSFTYTNNLVLTHTDERGLVTTNMWDALGRLISTSDPRGPIAYTYDKLDLVRVVDRMGFTNSFSYDNVRRKIGQTNALGYFTIYKYCNCGALDWIQDAGSNRTYFYYDNAGRRIQTVGSDGYTLSYNFNLFGEMTNMFDGAGYSLTNWFHSHPTGNGEKVLA